MKVEIIRNEHGWRQALQRCPAYDFYHTWDFHAISKNNGEGQPVLFVIGDAQNGILLPALERVISNTDWLDLSSVYGYPSPLAYGLSDQSDRILTLWEELLQFLRVRGYVSMFARGHPMLTPRILREKYYESIGDIVYVDCSLSEEEQIRKYRRNHKQNIKKLRKSGVGCVRGQGPVLLQKFQDIYEATMRSLGADDYYLFSEKYYQSLLLAQDFNTEIWIAELDGQPLSAGLLVYCGDFVEYHLSGTAPDYYSLAPSKLLIDEARRAATRTHKPYLILGGGYKNRADSLLNFKKGFSDQIAYFYIAKIILDHERYHMLCDDEETDFFPAYRVSDGQIIQTTDLRCSS